MVSYGSHGGRVRAVGGVLKQYETKNHFGWGFFSNKPKWDLLRRGAEKNSGFGRPRVGFERIASGDS